MYCASEIQPLCRILKRRCFNHLLRFFNMFWIDDGLVCDVHIHIVIVQSNKVCAQILYTVRYHIRNLS